MTIRTKVVGRLPKNKSEWDPNYVNPGTGQRGYGKMFRVFRYGCELESKIENNTYDPFDWDGDQNFVLDVAHWELCSGNPKVWAAGNPKPAASEEYPYNGMGRVVIPKNMQNIAEQGEPENIVNLLTQAAFEDSDSNPLTNTIFVIQYDFVLDEDITIPANCVLEFDGGSISGNNTLTGQNTDISADIIKIFGADVTMSGIWNIAKAYPEWFGVNDAAEVRKSIQTAVNISKHVLIKGEYNVQNSIYDPNEDMAEQRALIDNNTIPDDAITIGSNEIIEIIGKVKATSPLTDLFRVVGNNTTICGGGIIEGCGVVNDANSSDPSVQWVASLVRVTGNLNKIQNVKIYNPTTNGVNIKATSNHTIIDGCVFGGGLAAHGTGTALIAINNSGLMSIIENNRFVPYYGKNVYTAVFSAYQTDDSKIPYIFKNNYVEGVLEHAIYSYGNTGGHIEDNQIKDCVAVPLQLFCKGNTIKNNIIEWTYDSETYDPEYNPNGVSPISLRKGGHLIEGNIFKYITAKGILIDDTSVATQVQGDAENIKILNNDFYLRYDLGYTAISGINFSSPIGGIAKNVIIKGNNFIGVGVGGTCSTGCLEFQTARNDSDAEFENITIDSNTFNELYQQPVRFLSISKGEGVYGFKNLQIINNNVLHCTGSSWIAHLGPATFGVDKVNGFTIKGNCINNYDENGDSAYQSVFMRMKDSKDGVVTGNVCIGNDDVYTYLSGDFANGNIINRDNVFNYRQNGSVTLSPGDTYTESGTTYIGKKVNAPIEYYGDRYVKGVLLIPVNDAAIALQKTANAAYVELPPSVYPLTSEKYGFFKLRVAEDVAADCLFTWELVY